jgi:transcriptional regulator with XRE-family HTH domain
MKRPKLDPPAPEQNLEVIARQIRSTARKKVLALLDEQSVSQRDLGRAIDITGAATINQLLTDEDAEGQVTKRWTMERAYVVARHLNVSLDYLFNPKTPPGDPKALARISPAEAELLGRVRELGPEEARRRLNLQVGRVYVEAPAAEPPAAPPAEKGRTRPEDGGSRGVGGQRGG